MILKLFIAIPKLFIAITEVFITILNAFIAIPNPFIANRRLFHGFRRRIIGNGVGLFWVEILFLGIFFVNFGVRHLFNLQKR